MGYLFVVLGLIVVPWFAGVVAIFRSFGGKKNDPIDNRAQIANELFLLSQATQNQTEKNSFLVASRYLQGIRTPQSNDIPPNPEIFPETKLEVSPTYDRLADKTPEKNYDALKSLENINILLYIGAFLVVLAAGIFVGFNYQLMSGLAKTFFIAVFSLIFYLVGLYLYLKTEKIKPAGLTFTTIGLALFPLTGFAAFKFIFNSEGGNFVWFATSFITLIFYCISIQFVKKIYLNYLITFTALSLFESFVSLFNVPIYYFFWGMSIFAIVIGLVSKFSKRFKLSVEIAHPLGFSSALLQPISLLISLILTIKFGWQSAGINFILGAIFYFLLSFYSESESEKEGNFFASILLFPAGIAALLVGHHFQAMTIAYYLTAIALGYSISSFLLKKSVGNRSLFLAAFSGIIMIFSCISIFEVSKDLSIMLLFGLVVNVLSMISKRHYLNLVLAALNLLILPAVYFIGVKNSPPDQKNILSMAYFFCTVLLIGLAYYFDFIKDELSGIVSSFFYLIAAAITIGLLFAYGDHVFTLVFISIIAILYFLISTYFNKSINTLVGLALVLLIPPQLISIFKLDLVDLSWMYSIIAAAMYLIGNILNKTVEYKMIRYAGVATNALAILFAIAQGEINYFLALSTAVTAGIFFAESQYQKTEYTDYIGGIFLVGSIEFLLKKWGVHELHIYMLLWSALAAIIAYAENKKGNVDNRQGLIVISLGFLTIPLFYQAMDYYNGFSYGLLLGFESICVLIAGMYFKNKLATWWGTICLLLIAVNQLKDTLLALPKWLIIGIVGIAFLAGAVYLLSKRQETKD